MPPRLDLPISDNIQQLFVDEHDLIDTRQLFRLYHFNFSCRIAARMAFVSSITATPLRSASKTLRCSSRPVSLSSFRGARVAGPVCAPRANVRMELEISEGVAYPFNPIVIVVALAGWIIPSSIPTAIPLTGGTGLSQAFFASISRNLEHWPTGRKPNGNYVSRFSFWKRSFSAWLTLSSAVLLFVDHSFWLLLTMSFLFSRRLFACFIFRSGLGWSVLDFVLYVAHWHVCNSLLWLYWIRYQPKESINQSILSHDIALVFAFPDCSCRLFVCYIAHG